MTRLYANNFSTTLDGAISDSDTTITLTSVTGLPAIGSGDTCYLTLENLTNIEIVEATAVSGNDLTVVRGKESTSNVAFPDGAEVELRPTAASFDTLLIRPAMRARQSSAQTISASTGTQLEFDTEDFDTTNAFASHTYTPLVEGYYQVNLNVVMESMAADKTLSVYIYFDDGGGSAAYSQVTTTTVAGYNEISMNDIVYCDGSDDAIEAYIYHDDTTSRDTLAGTSTYLSIIRIA